ncbi:MAG: non-hydrolyzing UDP-N-acetylglucosamine 2-epimerase, partial [Fidelibacterota bacterium]
MKLLTIIGARPQFIKAATLSRLIRDRSDISEVIVHTGQHYDPNMSAVFFDELDIPQPDYNLEIGGLSHGAMTGRQLERIESVLQKEKPDLVIVYGDTNSTLAGTLAAVKEQIPVAHVEAGMRSFNRKMPEEINRVLTDHASDLLFAPTPAAVKNLELEGLGERCFYVGDVIYDAALYYEQRAEAKSGILDTIGLHPGKFILTTIHRAEITGDSDYLQTLFNELLELNHLHPIVLPLHPRTRKQLLNTSIFNTLEKEMIITEPVGYLDMVQLEKEALLIITDSGGVQREAFFHRTPCVTVREETEWTELVKLGWNHLLPRKRLPELVPVCLSRIKHVGADNNIFG